jgi:hypothetical protein
MPLVIIEYGPGWVPELVWTLWCGNKVLAFIVTPYKPPKIRNDK